MDNAIIAFFHDYGDILFLALGYFWPSACIP